MKYGLNLLLWTDRMHDGLMPVVERIKKLGYDGIEIPIFELDEPLYKDWSKKLDAIGLERQVRIGAGALVVVGVVLAQMVNPGFVWLSAFVGAGLVFAGVTGFCGMGLLLAKAPWNRA